MFPSEFERSLDTFFRNDLTRSLKSGFCSLLKSYGINISTLHMCESRCLFLRINIMTPPNVLPLHQYKPLNPNLHPWRQLHKNIKLTPSRSLFSLDHTQQSLKP